MAESARSTVETSASWHEMAQQQANERARELRAP